MTEPRSVGFMKKAQLKADWYNNTLKAQNNRCAICGKHHKDEKMSLAIDHKHGTGKIRGLLCHHCNKGLGMFGDSSNILERAARYLRHHSQVVGTSGEWNKPRYKIKRHN